MMRHSARSTLRAIPALLSTLFLASTAQAATCIGNCGELGADGVVSAPPGGASTYTWVSTDQGQSGGGVLADVGGTTGSQLRSDPFYAQSGSVVEFWFNYVTSDGAGYADYAWAQLQGATNSTVLFTARTRPTGSIVPGTDLPGVTATLNPASVEITPGAPVWSPLGGSSNTCYDAGCGYTGWVKSTYTVQESGTYSLVFGVSNWSDEAFQSGMAFQGLLLNGQVIGDGSTAEQPLLPSEINDDGGFEFTFTPTPNVPTFIDPIIAVGYDYTVTSGTNLITSAIFPVLAGDTDGYEIYALGDITPGGLLGTVLGGQTFTFATPVKGFSLRDIEETLNLDPDNPTAFVTGLTFATGDALTMSQTPVTVTTAVPEAETWAMALAGLALVGAWQRRRRSLTPAA